VAIVPLVESGFPEPPTRGRNDIEVATGKAAVIAALSRAPAVGLSSAFEVEALGRGRGGLTRRLPDPWPHDRNGLAGELQRLYVDLERGGHLSHDDRRASFRCLICLAWPDMTTHIVEGVVEGRLARSLDRTASFAACFVPDGERGVLASLDKQRRRACSAQERAIRLLRDEMLG
jgi:XTP/dITP diphosphohydrolase